MKNKEVPQYSAAEAKLLNMMLDCKRKILMATWRPILSFVFLNMLFVYFAIWKDLDSITLIIIMILIVLYVHVMDIIRRYDIDKYSKIFRNSLSKDIAHSAMQKHEEQYPNHFDWMFTMCNKQLGTNFHSSFYKKDD